MKLIPVDPSNEAHLRALYDLLAERPVEASISHKKMPTWEEHKEHVAAMTNPASERAHLDWCLIEGLKPPRVVGSVYLSANNEIGISIFRQYQGMWLGPDAVVMMMMKHGERNYYANINPANEASRKMFEKLGFKLIQYTLALEAK